jgi:hypothetical protein
MVREQLRTTTTTTTTATAVRGRAYGVVTYQQAAMPEQLLAPEPADPELDDQEPETGRGEAIDMTALRALRESRTEVEALDFTTDRLRRIQEAATKMINDSRAHADRHTTQAGADAVRPDDQQAHRPQQPGPHRGREADH